jgi:tRNA G18 (ribose-2'-O)-methylase SpoU
MEKTSQDGFFSEKDLHRLAGLLSSLALSGNLELTKLAQISEHLHPKMSVQHFINFLVPLERLLGRQISDDAFMISSGDRNQLLSPKVPLIFVLDNIRSAFNVGSIFRLADCLGVEKIFLCGYTATPASGSLDKTSLGTIESTAWVHRKSIQETLEELKSAGTQVAALETSPQSKSLFNARFSRQSQAFVVGNERFGLDATTLKACDAVINIPTFGMKNSLNVANALSIAGYEWRRQWN